MAGKQAPDRAGPLSPVAFQIMLSLADLPRHGYGIKLDIEERTDGGIRLGSGSLYETIQRLESLALIKESPPPSGAAGGRRRRYYELTARGRGALEAELVNMDRVVSYARDRNLLPES